MADIEFIDNSMVVKRNIFDKIGAFLLEASGELISQTARNSRVKTGQTKNSFQASVDEAEGIAYIGSNYENAIWEEFGTGLYALNGDGRKNVPWFYYDQEGNLHKTFGKHPTRAFWNAYNQLQGKIKEMAERVLSEL